MIFLYIAFGLFFYFFCMWIFRVVFLLLLLKIAGNVKKKVELEIKGKVDSLKGALKENGENMSNL